MALVGCLSRLSLSLSLSLPLVIGCGNANAPIDPTLPYGLIPTESSEYDFGEQRQGETLRHSFVLLNNTERTVKIVELQTSCQCVVAGDDELGSLTIPPQQRFSLPVSMKTSGSQEIASARVIVRYLDAANEHNVFRGELALIMRAKVHPDYRITPKLLNFGNVDGLETQTVTRSVRIAPDALTEFKIESVWSTSNFLEAALQSSQADKMETLLNVTLDVSKFSRSQSFTGMVMFETNSERNPRGVVQIQGRYVAPVEAQPGAVIISSTERGEIEREVRLVSARPSRILSVGLPADERLQARWSSEMIATEHRVTFAVSPCIAAALDAEIPVEFELLPGTNGGGGIRRCVTVPVHRFQQQENANE